MIDILPEQPKNDSGSNSSNDNIKLEEGGVQYVI